MNIAVSHEYIFSGLNTFFFVCSRNFWHIL